MTTKKPPGSRAAFCHLSLTRRSELVIHANLAGMERRTDVDAGEQNACAVVCIAQVDVHVLALERPVRCKHPLKTAADGPARMGLALGYGHETVCKRHLVDAPGETALGVEQQGIERHAE